MKIIKAEVIIKTWNDVCLTPVTGISIAEIVSRTKRLNGQLARFWSKSDEWASVAKAGLLGKTPMLAGYEERAARMVMSALVEQGMLAASSHRAPLRLAFPADVAERWFPRLYPAGLGEAM